MNISEFSTFLDDLAQDGVVGMTPYDDGEMIYLTFMLYGIRGTMRLRARPGAAKDARISCRNRVYAAAYIMLGEQQPQTWRAVTNVLKSNLKPEAIRLLIDQEHWRIIGLRYGALRFGT